MIEIFFNKVSKPKVLDDGILIIEGTEVLPINKIYLFDKNTFFKVQEVGSIYVVDLKQLNSKFYGYFYISPIDATFILRERSQEPIKIVGNFGENFQIQIENVSLGNEKSTIGKTSGILYKFSAEKYLIVRKKI